jgi:membrane protein YdbS with pleckstrin-like domain
MRTLDKDNRIDLHTLYPISRRVIVKRSSGWISFFILCVLIFLGINFGLDTAFFGADSHARLKIVAAGLLGFSVLGLALKLLYEECQRRCITYHVEDGHFMVKKGIILKQRGVFPLPRITDIYLQRDLWDLLLNLANLDVSTPTTYSADFTRIEGLPHPVAVALQKRLTTVVEMRAVVKPEGTASKVRNAAVGNSRSLSSERFLAEKRAASS